MEEEWSKKDDNSGSTFVVVFKLFMSQTVF